jgi:arylsulfatase A-like enzyme/predicted negative regulator of RcsB-dependent stress response
MLPRPIAVALLACGALLAPGCGSPRAAARAPAAGRPVVVVSIDTLRADRLPAYGYTKVETPHLDALRAESVLFENAYTHCPLTLPAHASLFTGLLPPEHGIRNNLGYRLEPKHPTLASLLKARGYATGAAVSAYVLRRTTGLDAGFDFYSDVATAAGTKSAAEVQRPGPETVKLALDWVRGVRERPFFLFVHVFEPHSPYAPPEPFRGRYGDTYDGEVAAADAAVGAVVAGLRELGVYDRSLVVLLSDHGEGLGDHGEAEHGVLLYREALHVPLLVKLPGRERAGSRETAPAGLRDVLPTLARRLGLDVPAEARGRDLLAPAREAAGVYSETFYPRIHLGWSELRSLVDDRYHLIDGPRPELYDLAHDPAEREDVLTARGQVAVAMRSALASGTSDFVPPAPASKEERERLASLGYLAAGASAPEAQSSRPNPRDRIASYAAVKAAFALVEQGKDEQAIAAFDRVLAENPGFVDALTERAAALGRLGRYRESARAYERAIASAPELAPTLSLTLARVHLEMGGFAEARAAAARALATEPDGAHELLASVALAASDLDAAEREAALVAADPGARARAAVVSAEVLARRGRPDEALSRLAGVEAGGPVPWLEFVRGDVLARLGRYPEAEAALRRGIASFPRHARAYASLAIVSALQGRPLAESRRILQDMRRAAPGRGSEALAERALAFIQQGVAPPAAASGSPG